MTDEFTTEALRLVFSPAARVGSFLRFETELAAAQAQVGIMPAPAAAEIGRACAVVADDDPERVIGETWLAGSPVLPLLASLRPHLGSGAAEWLHHGATSQDVIDTTTMVLTAEAVRLVEIDARRVAVALADLAETHRGTPLMGRTLLQPAVPVTFGIRCAAWLSAIDGNRADLAALRFPVQLGGPVGDGRGPVGAVVAGALAERLRLDVPASPWHADRSPILRIASALGMLAVSVEKLASDLVLMAGLGEVRTRPGRSSAMPHKRNPIDPIRAVAAASVCTAGVAGLFTASSHAFERAAGSWQAEWAIFPSVIQSCGAAVEAAAAALETIDVDADAMSAGVEASGDVDTGIVDRVLARHREINQRGR